MITELTTELTTEMDWKAFGKATLPVVAGMLLVTIFSGPINKLTNSVKDALPDSLK